MQLRLGLYDVMELPQACPDCGVENSIDHALGGGQRGGCGAARDRRHDEVVEFVNRLARDAGFHVPGVSEPRVGKIGGPGSKEGDTRCDGIVRGVWTPQRDCWFDVEIVYTGAVSHLMKDPAKTLEGEEEKKYKKHANRVAVAENADFMPIVASVHGTLAAHSQRFVTKCTEAAVGKKSAEAEGDFPTVLHLNRARFQAAVWRATAVCVVGRRGKAAEKATKAREAERKLQGEAAPLPWVCVAEDAQCT